MAQLCVIAYLMEGLFVQLSGLLWRVLFALRALGGAWHCCGSVGATGEPQLEHGNVQPTTNNNNGLTQGSSTDDCLVVGSLRSRRVHGLLLGIGLNAWNVLAIQECTQCTRRHRLCLARLLRVGHRDVVRVHWRSCSSTGHGARHHHAHHHGRHHRWHHHTTRRHHHARRWHHHSRWCTCRPGASCGCSTSASSTSCSCSCSCTCTCCCCGWRRCRCRCRRPNTARKQLFVCRQWEACLQCLQLGFVSG